MQDDSTPDYLIKAEIALEGERQRVQNYLNIETEPKILRVRCAVQLFSAIQRSHNQFTHLCFSVGKGGRARSFGRARNRAS